MASPTFESQPWSPGDVAFLSTWAGAFPLRQLAHAMGRPSVEVARRLDADGWGSTLTVAALARRLGCTPATVRRARQLSAPPPPAPVVELTIAAERLTPEGRPRARRPVVAVAEPGNATVEYPSAVVAAHARRVLAAQVYRSIRTGCPAGGRRWAWADGKTTVAKQAEIPVHKRSRRIPPVALPRPTVPVTPPPATPAIAVATASEAIDVLAARYEAGVTLGRVEVLIPDVVHADDDEVERAYRRQQEREAELAERDPWRPVLAAVRSKRA